MTPDPTVVMMGFNGMHSSGGYLNLWKPNAHLILPLGRFGQHNTTGRRRSQLGRMHHLALKWLKRAPLPDCNFQKKNPESKDKEYATI
jgi:hypothetical protein